LETALATLSNEHEALKKKVTKENEELKKDVPAHQASLPFREEYKEFEPLLKFALELENNPSDPKVVASYVEQISFAHKHKAKFFQWLQLSDPKYNDPTPFVRLLTIMSFGQPIDYLPIILPTYAAEIKKSPKDYLAAHLGGLNSILEDSAATWRLKC
jgi:hypothetical protein